MFGFLFVNMALQVVIISLLSCLQTYMQLCYQNYEWWWRSFAVGGAGGIYMAAYSFYFMFRNMKLGAVVSDASFLVYVYMLIGCYCFAAGAIAV